MARRQLDPEFTRFALLLMVASCFLVYLCLSTLFPPNSPPFPTPPVKVFDFAKEDEVKGQCCGGIGHLELWGDAVKWGDRFKLNSSKDCCFACKDMCNSIREGDGACLCNSWVFCGDQQACGSQFGECWLKKQKDVLEPDRKESGQQVKWTSGLVFGKGEGVIGLETEYGTVRLNLLPDCAPHSVSYILELLSFHHCAGCKFYRAEGRSSFWDLEGNHIKDASYGPPFALIQGTLETYGTAFQEIPMEHSPGIKRGSVAWVGSGPDFFISLANHDEWKKPYTVFAYVLPEDIATMDKIAQLPTKPEVWSNVDVAVLENPVPLRFRRVKNVNTKRDKNSG